MIGIQIIWRSNGHSRSRWLPVLPLFVFSSGLVYVFVYMYVSLRIPNAPLLLWALRASPVILDSHFFIRDADADPGMWPSGPG